eukprot:202386-Pleurochrysis_carterae.AAC.1
MVRRAEDSSCTKSSSAEVRWNDNAEGVRVNVGEGVGKASRVAAWVSSCTFEVMRCARAPA